MDIKFFIALGAVLLIGGVGYLSYAQGWSNTRPNPDTEINSHTPSDASGKININAVCEGALAYMTFSSGAEAELFVAECKEGKHPEVIEQYKASLNLDGAVI